MEKIVFLASTDADWATLQETLAHVDRAVMLTPGVTGNWSVKDIIAHIAWFEREMVGILENRSMEQGAEIWKLPPDERNAEIYRLNRARSLVDVLSDSQSVHNRLRKLLDEISEDDFKDPQRLGMPLDWQPWQVLAGNMFEHYREHRDMIEAWLQRGVR